MITSARTPDPGTGSVVSNLEASLDLATVLVYRVTHAACDVVIFNKAYVAGVVIVRLAIPPLTIALVVICAVVLVCSPEGVAHDTFPVPSLVRTSPLDPLVVG